MSDVKHVVILTQENRSFDHYFGTLQGVRGFSDPEALTLPDGKPAAANTISRRRSVIHNMLAHAVDEDLLDVNPLTRSHWSAPDAVHRGPGCGDQS